MIVLEFCECESNSEPSLVPQVRIEELEEELEGERGLRAKVRQTDNTTLDAQHLQKTQRIAR